MIAARSSDPESELSLHLSPGKSPRYLLVHDWLPSLGGSENVFEQICSLYPGTLVSSLVRRELFPWLEGRDLRCSRFQNLPFSLKKHYVFSPWMPAFYRNFNTSQFDVILVDSHSFAHHIRASKKAVYVCYYHTSARSLWNPEIDDRARSGRMAWFKKRLAIRLRKLDLEASKNPHYLIANSYTIAARIEKHYGRKVDEVIYPPVDVEKWLDTPRVDQSEGFLIWGRLIGYKRIDLAIEAAKMTGFKLNIVGSGPLNSQLRALASDAPNITFHGRLGDDALKILMARSRAVLFPGYEDFGIVPVEAMAAGLPVIAYGEGGAKETLQGHGLLIDRQDAGALAQKMIEIRDLEFDPEKLKAHAKQFDVSVFRSKYKLAVAKAMAKAKTS